MNEIDLPPNANNLINSTRSIGYSLESAISDIIDNSISACAKNIYLDFLPGNNSYISILDDGIGMDYDGINIAMQYGGKSSTSFRSSDDLGRFGLGLKTASLSQCRKLTIISKIDKSIEARCWDLDYIAERNAWSLLKLDNKEINDIPKIDELKKYKSGTLVVWQKLDRLQVGESNFKESFSRKIDLVHQRLSLIYHRYLKGEKDINKINIYINNKSIKGKNPFLTHRNTQCMDSEIFILNNEKIYITPYILPHPSKLTKNEIEDIGGLDNIKAFQGFYIYRNKRLIDWGKWFNIIKKEELSKLARVQIDIPNTLDYLWTLDIKKSVAIPPPELKKELKKFIEKVSQKSKHTYIYKGKSELSEDIDHIWNVIKTRNEGKLYEINKNLFLIKKIIDENPKIKSDLYTLINIIEYNLPLNSLYIDLSQDKFIENSNGLDLDNIINIIKNILQKININDKDSLIKKIIRSEPFSKYSNEIISLYKNGDL